MTKNRVIEAIEEVLRINNYTRITNAYSNAQTIMIDNYSSMFYQNEFGFLIYIVIDSVKDMKFKVHFLANVNLKESNISVKDFQKKIIEFCEIQILENSNDNIKILVDLEKTLAEHNCGLNGFTKYFVSNYKFNTEISIY